MMSSLTHLDQCLSSEIVMMTENIHKYLQGIVFLHIQFFTTCLAFLPDNNHKHLWFQSLCLFLVWMEPELLEPHQCQRNKEDC